MRGEKLVLKTTKFVKRNSSTILTCLGAAGVVTTLVLTAKATIKAEEVLKAAKEEKGDELTTLEKLNVMLPPYLPAIISGVATIACIFGSNIINKHHQASLISAYGVLDRSFKEYREKVSTLYGEECEKDVRKEIAKDHYDGPENPSDDDLLLFYDEWSNRYFWKRFSEVREAEYHLNRNLALAGDVELNEFYGFLGLEPTAFGTEVGWSLECGAQWYGYSWIDFDHELCESDDPNIPDFYIIRSEYGPTSDFLSYY